MRVSSGPLCYVLYSCSESSCSASLLCFSSPPCILLFLPIHFRHLFFIYHLLNLSPFCLPRDHLKSVVWFGSISGCQPPSSLSKFSLQSFTVSMPSSSYDVACYGGIAH